jgi:hypothetical protein
MGALEFWHGYTPELAVATPESPVGGAPHTIIAVDAEER